MKKLTLFIFFTLTLSTAFAKAGTFDSLGLIPNKLTVSHISNKLVEGNNTFACQLYNQIKSKKGNIFFSPFSISSCLAMCYSGAKADTASEMAAVLNFPGDQKKIPKGFARIFTNLREVMEKGSVNLSIANSLWAQKDYKFLSEYMSLTQKYYNAQIENLDFQNNADQAVQKINTWTGKKTNNLINEIISPGAVGSDTKLVLVNAIYFKGDWSCQFSPEKTSSSPFWIKPEESANIDMMFQEKYFQYGEDKNIQVLVLPYKGNDLSMVIILPKKRDGIKKLDENFTIKLLNKISRQPSFMNNSKVKVYMPKFKIGFSDELKKHLTAMGMKKAFDPSNADFSGMDNTRYLYINEVIHKAVLKLDEKGSEAAAATAVTMKLGSAARPYNPPKVFRADHPFIFMIKDNSTDSILFMGRLSEPVKR